jgi:hypothetical protein
MLKTVSSITNAIGAINYKGTWNASTNTPTIVSGTGVKGDYYVVSVAGTTTINGISKWGVGDWIVFNGTVWQRVEGGTDGNFLALSTNIVSKTFADTGYTATISDYTILVSASGGATTINLPAAAGFVGYIFVIKKIDSSANTVTVDAAGAETIDGAATRVLEYPYSSITVQSTGTSWFIIGEVLAGALLIE